MTTENPIRAARLDRGWTQEFLAAQSNISRMALLRTEQGLYKTPPVAILTSLDIPFEKTLKAYHNWQQEHRRTFGRNALDLWQFEKAMRLAKTFDKHPMIQWRQLSSGLSQIGLCKAFCLNPGPIHLWEKGEQIEMPVQLADAMVTAMMPVYIIKKLDETVKEIRSGSKV